MTRTGTQTWRQDFTYDRYGNRNFNQTNTTMPASFANPAITNPTISTTTNRITSSGWTYDSAGNTLTDANGQSYTYDGENKQTQVKNSSNATLGQYSYDGDGKRVKKYVPASGETTVFVYDAAGKQIAEYSTIVYTGTNAKVAYVTNDHLGSPRINTDANGSVTSRHDYHPFGEEIDGTGGRTTGLNYGDDSVRKQFTSYERDIESDLDFAQARMYANKLGRFTSVDSGPFTPADPQNFNRYAYTQNNPIKFTDPTGKQIYLNGDAADDFLDFLKNKTRLSLFRDAKTGKISIQKGSKRNEQGTSKNLANLVKDIISDSATINYQVKQNDSGSLFFDNQGDVTPNSAKKELNASIDYGDIKEANNQAPELAATVVSHFLFEGLKLANGESFVGDTTNGPGGEGAGAHPNALAFEAKVLSDFTGQKEKLAQREVDPNYSQNGTFHFIYNSVQYDVVVKSTTTNGAAIDKITKTKPSHPPKYP